MVGFVLVVFLVLFVGRLAWWASSVVLRTLAGFFVLAGVLTIVLHHLNAQGPYTDPGPRTVPGSILVLVLGLWLAGHVIFRLRHGWWRSRVLARAAALHRGRAPTSPRGLGE